jgi:hypothetical protein
VPLSEKGSWAGLALRTFDFLFLQGTHALEMHLRFLPSSLFPSFLLRRPFLGGASGAVSAALLLCFSMAASRRMACPQEADVGFRGRGLGL